MSRVHDALRRAAQDGPRLLSASTPQAMPVIDNTVLKVQAMELAIIERADQILAEGYNPDQVLSDQRVEEIAIKVACHLQAIGLCNELGLNLARILSSHSKLARRAKSQT